MTSPFSLLAVELVEEIVTHLDFHDIASFRLTCRDLERKASYGSFTQHFKTTNIDLTWDALQTFVDLTRHGRLGTHLQCCTISGIARNHEILHAERAEQLYLLTQAFDSLKRYSPRKSLASLSLRVSPDPRNGWENLPRDLNPLLSWRMVWKAAMNTFTLTMAALNTAGLAVDEEMNVFGTVKGCSLTSDTFFSFTQTPVFARTFWSMKTLTLSLSAPLQAFVRHSLEAETQSQMQTRYSGLALQDVARTLRSLPLLQVLEVHWYRIDRILEASRIAYSAEPHNQTATSDRDGLPQLARCTLRGLYLTSHHLLSFLTLTKPSDITLTDINLTAGSFVPIFAFIVNSTAGFHLDDLYQGSVLVHYDDVAGYPKFPSSGPRVGPSTVTCVYKTSTLFYRLASGQPRSSWSYHTWKVEKGKEYGPPYHERYEFDTYNSIA